MDCPSQYTNTMLRREVVMYLVNDWEWAFPRVRSLLRSNYGDPTEGGSQGPFSYTSYLRALLNDDFYGDSIVLFTISWMWGARITSVLLPNLSESRIRHDKDLGEVDIVVLLSGEHYSAVGKSVLALAL